MGLPTLADFMRGPWRERWRHLWRRWCPREPSMENPGQVRAERAGDGLRLAHQSQDDEPRPGAIRTRRIAHAEGVEGQRTAHRSQMPSQRQHGAHHVRSRPLDRPLAAATIVAVEQAQDGPVLDIPSQAVRSAVGSMIWPGWPMIAVGSTVTSKAGNRGSSFGRSQTFATPAKPSCRPLKSFLKNR